MKMIFAIFTVLWCGMSLIERLSGMDADYSAMMGMIHLAAFAILSKLEAA